ncbi:hypothetical protein NX059_000002 [Plenodomus lindquistii]|nr:hypothetical protein NX059_012492 [Plenodomus lindquistii]KAI8941888.1 hypothetical protein NX059_000002 [Plenodomus lindquistii]
MVQETTKKTHIPLRPQSPVVGVPSPRHSRRRAGLLEGPSMSTGTFFRGLGDVAEPQTQSTFQAGSQPVPVVRRSEPGRRSTFGYPTLPNTEEIRSSDEELEPTIPEHATHDSDSIHDYNIGDMRIECLKESEPLHVRLTYENLDFIEVFEQNGERVLRLGQESPSEDNPTTVTHTITTDDKMLKVVEDYPHWIRRDMIQMMASLRECVLAVDVARASAGSTVDHLEYANLKARYERLSEKSRKRLPTNEEPAFMELQSKLYDAEDVIDRLKDQVAVLKSGPKCQDPKHKDLEGDLAWEKEEADRYYQSSLAEQEKSKQFAAASEDLATKLDQANINLEKERKEVNSLVAVINRTQPGFRPYTSILQHQPRPGHPNNPYAGGPNNPYGNHPPGPPRRVRRDGLDDNPYGPPSPDVRQTTEGRPPSHNYNPEDVRYTTPAGNTTVITATGVHFKLPDVDIWTGEDPKKSYDKWRKLIVTKCETLPDDKQLPYLESRINGQAWELIDDMAFRNIYDLLDTLDQYFSRSSYERVADAQAKLQDGSLRMGNQSFAEWRGMFVPIIRRCKLPEAAMVGYARQNMRPGLAKDASIGFDDNMPNALTLFMDAARKADLMQRQINMGRPKEKAAPRGRHASPERRTSSFRRTQQQPQATNQVQRTQEQREAMNKKRVCWRCAEPGHQARDNTGCRILSWDKCKSKLSLAAAALRLAAITTEDNGEDDEDNQSFSEDGSETEDDIDLDLLDPSDDSHFH